MGIHHCRNNAHLFAQDYAETGAVCMDVGCGSKIKPCREAFKNHWISLWNHSFDLHPQQKLWRINIGIFKRFYK